MWFFFFFLPSASTRFVGKTYKEWVAKEQRRDAQYYFWVVLPGMLGMLGTVMYVAITDDSKGGRDFFNNIWFPACMIGLVVMTIVIYGLKRSLYVFAMLAVIIFGFIKLFKLIYGS